MYRFLMAVLDLIIWVHDLETLCTNKNLALPNDVVDADNINKLYYGTSVQPVPMEICSDTPVPQLSITQVYNTLRKIKQTATGPDCLPLWVWKENAAILTPAVHALWNLSLSMQTWPAAWKEANVNPLPKVDIPTQRENFRGILASRP